MSEIHTEEKNGWTITVWMSGHTIDSWNYIAHHGERCRASWVVAANRVDAVNKAYAEVTDWEKE